MHLVVNVLYFPFTYSAIAYFVAPEMGSQVRVTVPLPTDDTSGFGAVESFGVASTKSLLISSLSVRRR